MHTNIHSRTIYNTQDMEEGFPGGLVVKNQPTNLGETGNVGLIPKSGRSPAGGNGNPFQYSCLKNPMDRGAWRATVHGVAQSHTKLSTDSRIWKQLVSINK